MSELFKFKVGWSLAGIHLLMVLSCLLYVILIDKTAVLPVVILMILTAPWGTLSLFMPGLLGIKGETVHQNNALLFNVGMAVGGLLNAFILYILAFLLTRAFYYIKR